MRYAWALVLFPASVVLACLYMLRDVHTDPRAPHEWTHDPTRAWRKRYEAAFPALPYAADACVAKDSGDVCCICLDGHADRDMVRRLPCGHEFHAQCIDEWLFRGKGRTRSCPKCRRPVFCPAAGSHRLHGGPPSGVLMGADLFGV
mmetsp:Transcript_31841/g.63175  ORF Transcript_31841/g.63175 Transcript_31841/m.63175 type:complete len:146 (+) Transcript_31841:2-439(+)